MLRLVPLSLLVAAALPAQGFPRVRPIDAGFAQVRLDRLASYLKQQVDDRRAAGIVAIVARHGKVVFDGAWGLADREANRPMTMATRFRIASQSKAITSVAAMMLIEEGKLGLNDRVARFIPSFAATTVSTLADSAGMKVRRVVPARRGITVRDLLTHTSGYSYGTDGAVSAAYAMQGLGPKAGWGWYLADLPEDICTTISRLGTLPAMAQPGEEWVYGYGIDILGCVVERASGMPFATFLQQRLFGPLRMTSTSFCVPAAQRELLATVYALGDSGLVRAPDGARGQGSYVEGVGPCRDHSGGAGLVSTAGDYLRFLRMLENDGALDGVRLLAPTSVAQMTHDQVGALYLPAGRSFGLGFEVLEQPSRAGMFGNPGAYAWSGAYHTMYWVDPAAGLTAVMMVQLLPANGSTLQERFRTLVYQAMIDTPRPTIR